MVYISMKVRVKWLATFVQELQSYLGNVLNETLALRNFETTLHAGIHRELERREQLQQLKAERVARGNYCRTPAPTAIWKLLCSLLSL